MTETILISLPIDEFQMLIIRCVNSCLKCHEPQPLQPQIPYKDTKEAAEFLSKTPNALRVMVCKNQIKSIKKGNSLYFLESDLIEYLESGRRKTPAELAQNCEDALVIKKGGFQK